MKRMLCLLLLAVSGLCACQGQGAALSASAAAPGWDIGPLPAAARHASATSVINGADYDAVGYGTAVAGTALTLNAAGIDYSWARYAFTVPAGTNVHKLSLDVQDAASEYWVALSNYARGTWEWHGPYNLSASPPFNQPVSNYTSPGGVFYWVVLAVRGNDLQLNSSTVDCLKLELKVASQGEQTIITGGCTSPSVVHLPQIDPGVEAGAPLIAYIHQEVADSKLYLAYNTSGGWRSLPIVPEDNFLHPELRWLGAEGIITAYDITDVALVDIRFDAGLNVKSVTTIMPGPASVLVNQSLDIGPGGVLGLAHAYSDSTLGQLYFSTNDGTGWVNSSALHYNDPVTGLSFRYDPQGGDPWLMYTHGTIDTSSSVIIRYTLEEGRRKDGAWNFTPFDYPDAPLSVDLEFSGTGAPRICFLAARDYSINFPPFISYTGSLLYDAVVAAKNGDTWNTAKVYTATIIPHYTFPNDYVMLDVAACSEVGWASADQLAYSKITGSVKFDIATQQPTDGELTPAVQYMVDTGSSLVDDARFNGSPGAGFSWSPDVDGYPAAAYIKSDTVDPMALFNGQITQASDLVYWRLFVVLPG
jgi:hypothetical protein